MRPVLRNDKSLAYHETTHTALVENRTTSRSRSWYCVCVTRLAWRQHRLDMSGGKLCPVHVGLRLLNLTELCTQDASCKFVDRVSSSEASTFFCRFSLLAYFTLVMGVCGRILQVWSNSSLASLRGWMKTAILLPHAKRTPPILLTSAENCLAGGDIFPVYGTKMISQPYTASTVGLCSVGKKTSMHERIHTTRLQRFRGSKSRRK